MGRLGARRLGSFCACTMAIWALQCCCCCWYAAYIIACTSGGYAAEPVVPP